MATKIVTKNRLADSTIPNNSDLLKGELAVNLVSFKLYSSTDATDIIEICPVGTLTSGLGLTGGAAMSGDFTLDIGAGTGITVNADDVQINLTYADDRWGTKASANTWAALQTFSSGATLGDTLTLPSTWEIDVVGSDIVLSYGGATVLKFTSAGAIVAEGDVTAFGTVA